MITSVFVSSLTTTYTDSQWLTWFRSIIKVDKPTDTVSLVCIRVKILSVRPIVADSAGTKLPICAKNTIKPTCKDKSIYRKSSYYMTSQKVEQETRKKAKENEARKKDESRFKLAEAFFLDGSLSR